MPRKTNKRKAIQAMKRMASAEIEERKSRLSPAVEAPRVARIAHHNGSTMALAALLLGAGVFARPTTGDSE